MDYKPNSEYRTVRGYQIANQQKNELTPAMEDYLEMACRLCLQNGYTRVGRLSELLNVRPSSSSKMILRLTELGYLEYDRYESILLTDKGRKTGTYLIYRHETMERFLTLLGSEHPLEEAEQIEHFLSSQTVDKLNALLEFLQSNNAILKGLERHIKNRLERDGGTSGDQDQCE